ncbi:MAG: FprA family A-type flavoprotein [Nanoarchaeota archaeon]
MERQITERILEVGVRDRIRELFDEIIPLPNGTSYNAYVVRGRDKIALIDTVEPKFAQALLKNLSSIGIERIDYIIANHAEQDHSGSIPEVLARFPDAKVLCSKKCISMLHDLLDLDQNSVVGVKHEDEIELGGITLRFLMTPWVHWPETMSTYAVEEEVLFSCDFFGAHVASEDLFVSGTDALESAKRYYAEIMMPFASFIRKNLQTLSDLRIRYIAPSHGQVYTEPPSIVDAYVKWAGPSVEKSTVIAYVSMHGSTAAMVAMLTESLKKKNVKVITHNLTETDIGELAIDLVDAGGIVLASPSFLAGAHPKALMAAHLISTLKPRARVIGIMGSYGWGSMMDTQLSALLEKLEGTLLEPVMVKGLPKNPETINELAADIVKILAQNT